MSAVPANTFRLLAIEDDHVLGAHLHSHLARQGFDVTLCDDGRAGLELALRESFDLVLLDILLPGINGLDILARLREDGGLPVILLSALGAEQDRITGFSGGADDYLPKPFSMAELSVRIGAVLRRVELERNKPGPRAAGIAGLALDENRQDAHCNGRWLGLTGTEYRLLEQLLSQPGEAFDKPFLYQQVLNRGFGQHDRSLDMHVSHLRRKLERVGYARGELRTVWGQGYMFRELS